MGKTSIKIKRFWYADVAADGGAGTNWVEVQSYQREATVQFNGSDADKSDYKNVEGNILESAMTKGIKTANFQLADLTPSVVAEFTGGTVSEDSNSEKYEAPLNENQSIEKSLKFLTEKNVLVTISRVSIDAYPIMNDDDLHYYQVNTTVLKPEKANTGSFTMEILKLPAANDVISFTFGSTIDSAPATISAVTHTVAITVVALTDPATLTPTIGVSLGASVAGSGVETDFTNPVVYSVKAADGTTQNWTVTVTVTP